MKLTIFTLTLLLSSIASYASEIKITDAYVRLLPPTAKNTAAFMTIKNKSNKDVELLSVESNVAMAVELHTHVEEKGMMRMREVDSILIKKGSSTQLKPGSFHVMIMGLKKPLVDGKKIKFKFNFSDKSIKEMVLTVKSMIKESNDQDSSHSHHHH